MTKKYRLISTLACGALATGLALPAAAQQQRQVNISEDDLAGLEESAVEISADSSDPEGVDPQGSEPRDITEPDPSQMRGEVAQPSSRDVGPAQIRSWTRDDAGALVEAVSRLDRYALSPQSYDTSALRAAIKKGDKPLVDMIASRLFTDVIVDLRDGVTPMDQRLDWYIDDTDGDRLPAIRLMEIALSRHDIEGIFRAVQPTHDDYWRLLDTYANTPKSNTKRRQLLAVNIERWRWLPRSLGDRYIYVNVPQYQTELIDDGQLVARHNVVVGKNSTPTPQLSTEVKGAIFNPKWYLPQSIVAEGIGNTIRTNPAAARAKGYTWTRDGNRLYVVQGAGPGNALGLVKLDMPNDHAIYLHDTPSKGAFNEDKRAFSHGCIRTEKALLFMGMLAVRYAGKSKEDLQMIMESKETTPVAFDSRFPAYILYFTASPGDDGTIRYYEDIYGRDAPVGKALASRASVTNERVAAR